MSEAFAVWITGRPASGKSTITAALTAALLARGVDLEVIESDVLRRAITPQPTYSDAEREIFYAAMVTVGELLVKHGVSVVFDATAHRASWRDRARERFPRFAEVYVECPEEVCVARDPKGIYRKAREGLTTTVPGLQLGYDAPRCPEVVVRGDLERPEDAAQKIINHLSAQCWIRRWM